MKITWDNVGKFLGEYLAHGEHSVILDCHQPLQQWTLCWSWRHFVLFNFHAADTGRVGEDRSLLWSPCHFDSILEFSSEVFLDLLCLFTWTMNCMGVANHSFKILASKYERILGTTQFFLLVLNHTPGVIKILWLKKKLYCSEWTQLIGWIHHPSLRQTVFISTANYKQLVVAFYRSFEKYCKA